MSINYISIYQIIFIAISDDFLVKTDENGSNCEPI